MTAVARTGQGAWVPGAGGVESHEKAVRDAGKAYDRAAERLRGSSAQTASDDPAGARARESAAASVQLAAARLASAQGALAQARAAAPERQSQRQVERQDDVGRTTSAERVDVAPQGRLDTYL